MHFSTALLTTLLALPTAFSIAIPEAMPLSPDPAGTKNIGNGKGVQFIGGACLNQADCASACCATLNGAGICSGPGAQFQAGKQGCGFGGAGGAGSQTAAAPPPSTATSGSSSSGSSGSSANGVTIDTSIPGSQSVGKANGQQFITGQCTSNADCASACCAGLPTANKGPTFAVCSGPAVGNAAGKTGCGFSVSNGVPSTPGSGTSNNDADTGSKHDGFFVDTSIPGSQSVGKKNAQQFITGQCTSNADCASACCAGLPTANKGVSFAVCSGPAVGNAAGKTGCGFTLSVSSSTAQTGDSTDEECSD